MTTKWKVPASILAAASLTALVPVASLAGSFTADFNNNQVPPGTQINGNAKIANGVCHLTDAVASQSGSFVIDSLDADPVNGLDLTFKNRTGGGGTHADGWSFCFGAIGMNQQWGEVPPSTGLGVAIDTYNNGGEAPSVNLYWNGAEIGHIMVAQSALDTGSSFVDAHIHLYSDGTVDFSFRGVDYYKGLAIPGFAPITGGRFGWSARTGGAMDNQWVDDIVLTTTTGGVAPGITRQPMTQTVLDGASAAFYPLLLNTDPAVVSSVQWQVKGFSDLDFVDIFGANSLSYKSDPLSWVNSEDQYRLLVFGASGVNLTSSVATVSVILPPDLPAPTESFTFDDGFVPSGTLAVANAGIVIGGGAGGSEGLQLVAGANGQQGAWLVPNFLVDNGGVPKPAGAMTAHFFVRAGDNTIPPADGWSFNWATDFPTTSFPASVEEGVGTGLSVSVDVYDNGGNDYAPGVTILFHGAVVARYLLPYEYLLTGADFGEVIVKLQPTGLLTVSYNGLVLFQNLQLPNWTALTGAFFGWGARTGGLNESVTLDNVDLTVEEYVGPIVYVTQPSDTITIPGQTATFSVTVNDPVHAAFKWLSKLPGAADFTDVSGATAASYTTPVLTAADDGTLFYCQVTGPINVTNSTTAKLTVVNLVPPTSGDFCTDFDTGALPAGSVIYGNTVVSASGGVGNSGMLDLNDAVGGAAGAWLIENFLGAQAIDGFTVGFDIKVDWTGQWAPADGWSFNVATDLPAGTIGGAEQGAGSGLTIGVDTYDNGTATGSFPAPDAPAINIKWKGTYLAHTMVTREFLTGTDYRKVLIRLNPNGTVDMAYNGVLVFNSVPLPGFLPMSQLKWGMYTRTGGAMETHYVDNFCLQTHAYVGPISIIKDPVNMEAPVGTPVTFSAASSDPSRTTWEWQQKLPTDDAFVTVPGATLGTFSASLADASESGTQFRAIGISSVNNATSQVATLTALILPPPTVSYDFGDCSTQPPNTRFLGTAGLTDSGDPAYGCVAQLTFDAAGLEGSFIVDPDPAVPPTPVAGWSIFWNMVLGGGTATPADGISLVVTTDPLTSPWGEEGSGGQFIVSFDTYDNGNGDDAPSIDVRWMGDNLAHHHLQIPELATWPNWVNVAVRVSPAGLCDVIFNNQIIFHQLQLPNYAASAFTTTPRVGWSGRTGGLTEIARLDNIQVAWFPGALPALTIAPVAGNKVSVAFTGVLQVSDKVDSGYQDVVGASPMEFDLSSGASKFFRSRNP